MSEFSWAGRNILLVWDLLHQKGQDQWTTLVDVAMPQWHVNESLRSMWTFLSKFVLPIVLEEVSGNISISLFFRGYFNFF